MGITMAPIFLVLESSKWIRDVGPKAVAPKAAYVEGANWGSIHGAQDLLSRVLPFFLYNREASIT